MSMMEDAHFLSIIPMKGARFDKIITRLIYSNYLPPIFVDRFWEVRQVIRVWEYHTKKSFVPSWVNCLDDIMSIFSNKWTCPGWIFCIRKTYTFGNEHHRICCGLSCIIFDFDLVEGGAVLVRSLLISMKVLGICFGWLWICVIIFIQEIIF